MQEDEASTIATLAESKELMADLIQQYRGRVVDAPGDNLLAEFGSVVDATECAVKIQKELNAKNARLPDDRKMPFRIGVNLGDVVEEADRIYGDGVNIAARLEGLAEPGGICISRTAYDHVKNKLEFGYEYLGEHSIKNIAEPVRVYRVLMEPEAAGKVIGEKRFIGKISRRAAVTAIAILAIVAGGLIGWNLYLHQSKKIEPASIDQMAFPLPDKPSIAVLPFDNISGDPKQEYFSDGMTDDLITDLSKISGLFVIARNSTFAYKGKPIKIRQVAEELSVRYILEGSVRRVADRIRINAQLIDATTGGHLWAERYDGNLGDVFSLQDNITRKIVFALAIKLTQNEEAEVARKDTIEIPAYDAFLQGWAHYVRHTPDDFARAIQYFEKAVELDPNYGRAYAALAATYWESFYRFWHESLNVEWHETRLRAEEYIQLAMKKDPTPLAHGVTSKMLIAQHKYDEALAETERALALDPNDAGSFIAMAYALIYFGKPKEAVDYIERAMRIDPEYPAYYLFVLGLAHFGMEQLEKAASLFEEALERNPENYVTLIPLAATYAHLNRKKEATDIIERLDEFMPIVTLALIEECPLWQYKNYNDRDRLMSGLEKAGMAKTAYDLLSYLPLIRMTAQGRILFYTMSQWQKS
ncbi:MAG: tetratricopeptide repeat protein [Deltaproteobacteria bacterium]|nr:tetratricopeptide repeat protein [Deltaproteobacteria bacterium]